MSSDVLSRTAAADELHTTARALRYREALGLLPPADRRYGSAQMAAAEYAVELEQTYDVSPKTLAFAMRAVIDDEVRADVLRLCELTGRRLGRAARALAVGWGQVRLAASPSRAGNRRPGASGTDPARGR